MNVLKSILATLGCIVTTLALCFVVFMVHFSLHVIMSVMGMKIP